MIKRTISLIVPVLTLALLISVFAGTCAFAESADVATFTFDTDATLANFYTQGNIDATLSITNAVSFTGNSLKVVLNVPDERARECRILFDAGKLKFLNFNDCTIEAHVFFPQDYNTVWGPGTQSVSLITTDPSWVASETDRTVFGTWQTVTLSCGANTNNKTFGFSIPVANNNAGEIVLYIDDIRIVKENELVASLDADPNLTYPLPTNTGATSEIVENPENPTEEVVSEEPASTTIQVPTGDTNSKSSLIIILIISFVIIAAVAGIIYFFVWKSKNKYY